MHLVNLDRLPITGNSSIPRKTIKQLQPRIIDRDKVKMMRHFKQQRQKAYYDQHSKPVPEIRKGDRIRVRMKGLWKPELWWIKLKLTHQN